MSQDSSPSSQPASQNSGSNNNKAYVNDMQVPCRLSAEQARTMFPAGAIFRNTTTGETLIPNTDGTLTFEAGARYVPLGSPTSMHHSNHHHQLPPVGPSSTRTSMPPRSGHTRSGSRGQLFGSGAAGAMAGAAAGSNGPGFVSPGRNRLACTGGDSDDEVGLIVTPRRLSQQEHSIGGGGVGGGGVVGTGEHPPVFSQLSQEDGVDADGFPSPRVVDDAMTSTGPVSSPQAGVTQQQMTGSRNQQQHLLANTMSQVSVRRGKMIMDRVHDHIMLPPLVCRMVDTPEFQRLRYLKQLGSCAYLYPGATHTRFEHSIGVAHLAGLMAKKIARRQPELQVTDLEIVLLMVAGLCHDLGHGPFSHLFEVVVKHALHERGSTRKWHHEEMSARLVRRIFAALRAAGDETVRDIDDEDVNFVVLAIEGLKPGAPWPSNVGRSEGKRFLLDIVANKRNGIDVDKLDYFMRDSLACYGKAAIDIHIARLINSVRAIRHEGEWQICYEEKMALSLGDIFSVRAKLHKYAYQHRTTKVVDNMIRDALMAAEPFFKVRGSNGRMLRLMDAIDDDEAFTELGDWILNAIASTSDPELQKARDIVHRLHTRQLYPLVGIAQLKQGSARGLGSTSDIAMEIANCLRSDNGNASIYALRDTLIVEWIKITYGSSDFDGSACDPIDRVTFFNPKGDCNQGFTLPKDRRNPLFSPMALEERSLLVMVRDREMQGDAHECFERWKSQKAYMWENAVPTHNSPARRQRELSVGTVTGGGAGGTSLTFTAATSGAATAMNTQQQQQKDQRAPPLQQNLSQ